MQQSQNAALAPVLFVPHGGGPLPLLSDPRHASLIAFLRGLADQLEEPAAILVISAHWEAPVASVTSGAHPALIYDYYGFPAEAYRVSYPAAGAPPLAQRVLSLLRAAGLAGAEDAQRGFDHGMFVPLKLIFPRAQIPCVQLSLLASLEPEQHLALGRAIAPLRLERVLVLGSGMSFHNLPAFFAAGAAEAAAASADFDDWLAEVCTGAALSPAERARRLCDWSRAPRARYCHPREEHLLPLHVCYGAAEAGGDRGRRIYRDRLMGQWVSAFRW